MSRRDTKRSAVYAAECTVFDHNPRHPLTLDEVRAYVAKVWADPLFAKRVPIAVARQRAPKVLDGRGRTSAVSHKGAVSFPTWARQHWVVLHELAHEAINHEHPAAPGHGVEWRVLYLWLVERHLGFDARQKLGAAFKAHGVPLVAKPARTRTRVLARPKPAKPPTKSERLRARLVAAEPRATLERWGRGWLVDDAAGTTAECRDLLEVEWAVEDVERAQKGRRRISVKIVE